MKYLFNLDLKLQTNSLTIFNYFTYIHLFFKTTTYSINYYKNFTLAITIGENIFIYFSGLYLLIIFYACAILKYATHLCKLKKFRLTIFKAYDCPQGRRDLEAKEALPQGPPKNRPPPRKIEDPKFCY